MTEDFGIELPDDGAYVCDCGRRVNKRGHEPGIWDPVHLDGGTLDLGIWRDSFLSTRNDFRIFSEEFVALVLPEEYQASVATVDRRSIFYSNALTPESETPVTEPMDPELQRLLDEEDEIQRSTRAAHEIGSIERILADEQANAKLDALFDDPELTAWLEEGGVVAVEVTEPKDLLRLALVGRSGYTRHVARFFTYDHLRHPKMRAVSSEITALAASMISLLEDGPELTVALRQLVEAKDTLVRCVVVELDDE